jgi:NAD(P)-dependent dehydrogenase (short-subunit alcohol dehydrogenase family)
MGYVDLKDKVVLVTGSARRVGKAILLEFARHGAKVVVHHHSSDDEAAATAKEARDLGCETLVCKADVSNPGELDALFADIEATFGRLDVLVNSAAIFDQQDFLDITLEDWNRSMSINLTAPFLATQRAAKLMMQNENGGAIVNITDNGGRRPWPKRAAHGVSKAGLIMLTQVSAVALGEHNIRVNGIAPGPILPPPGRTREDWSFYNDRLPLGRIGEPEDVARAAVFLATNDFITGEVLGVDGGSILVASD